MTKKYRVWYKDYRMGYIDVEAGDEAEANKTADDILYDKRGNLDAYSDYMDPGFEHVETKELKGDKLYDNLVGC